MFPQTTAQPANLRLWTEELADFLPAKIFDAHVHAFPAAIMPASETYSCAGHPLSAYTLDDLSAHLAAAYPGRETAALCFGMPYPAWDRPANNAYLARACDRRRFFPLRLLDPAEDPAAVRADVLSNHFLGFKPYPDYLRAVPPADIEIRHMLPDPLMAVADDLGLLVMLHVPRPGRLADPLNQRQLVDLCTRFPRAQIILAHIGRAYYLQNITGQLEALRPLPNLYFDTAMLNHWEVLAYLFSRIPAHRLLFGSDAPIAFAPGKSVEINDQYTYITPVPWELSLHDPRGKIRFTSFLYEELRPLRKAVETLRLPRPFVEDLFWTNARRLLPTP